MQPLIWLGILALLLVVEAITAGLTTIWFAGGALAAFVLAMRRIGRSYCVLCRGEPDCTDTVFFVRFSGTFDFYQTFGHEVLQQRNHTDQCKQSDWKESSCDSGD